MCRQDRFANRPAGALRVDIHRPQSIDDQRSAQAEIRAPLISNLDAAPLGEGLVEPEIVPPDRSHQVADPVMCDLMCRDLAESRICCSGASGAEQNQGVVEEDRPGVLHGTAHIGRRDQVEFRVRVRDPEALSRRRTSSGVPRSVRASLLPWPRVATPRNGEGLVRMSFGAMAGASTTSRGRAALIATREVGSGMWARYRSNPAHPAFGALDQELRVRFRLVVLLGRRSRSRQFEARLVKARTRTTCIDGFDL